MDATDKVKDIAELTSGMKMASVSFKHIFLLSLQLLCYTFALVYIIAAVYIMQFNLDSLAGYIDDPETTEIIANLPHKWHLVFDKITNFVALFFFLLFVKMFIQGRVINSLNKSNKTLKQISTIVRR